MRYTSAVKRAGVVAGTAAALVALGSTAASAHDCFIPMYTLNAPHSANWISFSAEEGAAEIAGFATECDAQREAGYGALREAGLPVGLRIFGHMTIGEGYNYIVSGQTGESTGSGQGADTNPNGANNVGLEYFEAGSTLPDEMLGTYIGAASQVTC